MLAARQALADAGFTRATFPESTLLSFSTSKGAVMSVEGQLSGPDALILPLERLAPGGAALAVAGELGIQGPVACRTAACASGLVSVLMAAREVASGRADLAVAGASEASLTPFIHAGFAAMGALVMEGAVQPEEAVRPFDRERRGFLLGEGAAVFILESAESVERRGVRVRGWLSGGAELCEAHSIAAPEPRGEATERAARLALERAGLQTQDLGSIWLHGTATLAGDKAELSAVGRLAAGTGSALPATASKGLTGHMLGASGAVELAFAAGCLEAGFLPAVANLNAPLAQPEISLVQGRAQSVAAGPCLVLSAGFGGHVAAVILDKTQ